MHLFKLIVLIFAVVCPLLCGSEIINDEQAGRKTTKTSTTITTTTLPTTKLTTTTPATTTTTPETTTTTPATTTTTPATTTTTPATTTTTPATTTTTPATTTTTPATTTTTPATNTTTPEPSTTTPAPVPYPEPSVGTWNSSCILVKMAAQLNFTYQTKDNGTAFALVNVPTDAKVQDSECTMNNLTQNIHISWGPNEVDYAMVMQFDRVNNTVKMTMLYFTVPLSTDHTPDAKDNGTIQLVHRGSDFSSPVQMSYHCTRAQKLNLTETVTNNITVGHVKIHDVQTEAFRSVNAKGFAEARDCDSSESSDIVPIAVGIALAALILIVLVAYLCARRRSTSRGYMSF